MVIYSANGLTRRSQARELLALAAKEHWGLSPLPEIARHEGGKPFFPGHEDLHFNLSHSGELALCALDGAPVGADIQVAGRAAMVSGAGRLHGAGVCASDLRGGAALVVAGLAAEGVTQVSGLRYIRRGYQDLDRNLRALGADIRERPANCEQRRTLCQDPVGAAEHADETGAGLGRCSSCCA